MSHEETHSVYGDPPIRYRWVWVRMKIDLLDTASDASVMPSS